MKKIVFNAIIFKISLKIEKSDLHYSNLYILINRSVHWSKEEGKGRGRARRASSPQKIESLF